MPPYVEPSPNKFSSHPGSAPAPPDYAHGIYHNFISLCFNKRAAMMRVRDNKFSSRISSVSYTVFFLICVSTVMMCLAPVSYTHLTLPTNREV